VAIETPAASATCRIVVAIALWLVGRRALALGWTLSLAGNGLLNPALKQIFARARPVHEHGLAMETGFSFPSGHSSGSMVFYGMLLYLGIRLLPARWHPLLAAAATAVVVTVASSRIFLQVHFASDVAAGLLLVKEAGGFVTDFRGGERPVERSEFLAANDVLHSKLHKLLANSLR
jgi:membrane-associated phospholipid phosphatase